MQEKRYQVFISSTFMDLQAERRAVQDVVISTGDFPVQMESFPAADEDQFEFIKSLIDQCDYYVLIIAGRYGTVAEDGLSYTHKEFRYAVSKGVPVLVMLHGDRGSIPADRTEEADEGRRRLAEFIAEAEKGRLRKPWTTLDALKLAVREALDNAKATKPRPGWVRGDAIANVDVLEELNTVRKENDKYKEALSNLHVEIPLPNIPDPNDEVEIQLLPSGKNKRGTQATVKGTWISIFPTFFSNLEWGTNDYSGDAYINPDESCVAIGSALAGEVSSNNTVNMYMISRGTYNRLVSYYTEAGLMTTVDGMPPFTEVAQKIARRHSISGGPSTSLALSAGKIRVDTSGSFLRNLDEDIPF